jgi:hypothetical protein
LGLVTPFLFDEDIKYTIGTWGIDKEGEFSNYKELRNTVVAIEHHAKEGKLDNATVENALYHGRTKMSRTLHEPVVRMKLLEAKHNFQLLVIHVSGEQMKAQGVDGVSSSQLTEGIMHGESILSFFGCLQQRWSDSLI